MRLRIALSIMLALVLVLLMACGAQEKVHTGIGTSPSLDDEALDDEALPSVDAGPEPDAAADIR